MADQTQPLTDEERAELEELRAEKARREEAQRARQERAELERLRSQRRYEEHAQAADVAARNREERARERGRALMEPGEDLSMPLGQRIVLIGLALIVCGIVCALLFAKG